MSDFGSFDHIQSYTIWCLLVSSPVTFRPAFSRVAVTIYHAPNILARSALECFKMYHFLLKISNISYFYNHPKNI